MEATAYYGLILHCTSANPLTYPQESWTSATSSLTLLHLVVSFRVGYTNSMETEPESTPETTVAAPLGEGMAIIKAYLKTLPASPGVYRMMNARGEVLHTGCVAFGMDRLAVALFVTHGAKISAWPARNTG